MKNMNTSTQASATGASYMISDSPFMVNNEPVPQSYRTGSYLGFVRKGQELTITAGDLPVYVGGMKYRTVANGSSNPGVIPPGETQKWKLVRVGNPHIFSLWKKVPD